MAKPLRLYKVLAPGLKACHGGTFTYPEPKNGRPGRWTKRVKDVRICASGYHLVTAEHIHRWLFRGGAREVWEAEPDGRPRYYNREFVISKRAYPRVRLLRRVISESQSEQFRVVRPCCCGCGNPVTSINEAALADFLRMDAKKNPQRPRRE